MPFDSNVRWDRVMIIGNMVLVPLVLLIDVSLNSSFARHPQLALQHDRVMSSPRQESFHHFRLPVVVFFNTLIYKKLHYTSTYINFLINVLRL